MTTDHMHDLAELMVSIDAAIDVATRLQLRLYNEELDAAMDAGIATGYLRAAKDCVKSGLYATADKLAAQGETLLDEVAAKVEKERDAGL